MRDVQESMTNMLVFQIFVLGLLICAISRKSRKAAAIIIAADLFLWHQSAKNASTDHPLPGNITVSSCPKSVSVANPYNWFSPLGAIKDHNKEDSQTWGAGFKEKHEVAYKKLTAEQGEQFKQSFEQMVDLKKMQLTFKTFKSGIGGRCIEHADLALLKNLKPMIEHGWAENVTYPIQRFRIRGREIWGHEFIVIRGLGKEITLRGQKEIWDYYKLLAQNPDVFLQDTWVHPERGGICEKFSVLYAQRDKAGSLSFWQSNPFYWYFSPHIFQLNVSPDYGRRIHIPETLPFELQELLREMRENVYQEIVVTVNEQEKSDSLVAINPSR